MRSSTFFLIVLAVFALFLTTNAYAITCQDTLTPGINCTLITPVLSCGNQSYTYSIYNTSTKVVQNQNLTLVNDSIYKTVFTQTNPDTYTVVLCDNSSSQIIVTDEDSQMIYGIITAIFLFFALVAFICLWLSREVWVKLVFALVFNVMITSLVFFARLFTQITNPSLTSLLNVLDYFYLITLVGYPILLVAIIMYAIFRIVYDGSDKISKFANKPYSNQFGKMGRGVM